MRNFEEFYRNQLINKGHNVPEETARLIYESVCEDYEDTIYWIERDYEETLEARDLEIDELIESQELFINTA